jgi:hypothetical protein
MKDREEPKMNAQTVPPFANATSEGDAPAKPSMPACMAPNPPNCVPAVPPTAMVGLALCLTALAVTFMRRPRTT